MRTTKRPANGSLVKAVDDEAARCHSGHHDVGLHKSVSPLGIFSAVAVLALTACSESREPSIDVSDATISQYQNTCGLCHENGDGGAPITGDTEDWQERVAKGMRKVHENAIVGYEGATGIMPAKGGYENLTDDEVIAIVDYMVDMSR